MVHEEKEENLELLNAFRDSVIDLIWGKILFYSLIPIGVYFTIRFYFAQIRYFPKMWAITLGSIKDKNKGISGFQALMISTAARVGTGNLAGVAIALSVGGPGAIFWMWMVAFFGMGTAIVENSLAQLYKKKDEQGLFYGGPAFYLKNGIGGKIGRVLAFLFAISIVLCFGFAINGVQANTIANSLAEYEVPSNFVALFLLAITAYIVFGGLKRVANFVQIFVPFMAVFYIILTLYILATHFKEIPSVFSLIFEYAFGFKQAAAGVFGYTVNAAITNGVRRGLFSNEAGLGSSPNAAATAVVRHPIEQGFIQALGVFIDTILICSCTAFIILLSGTFDMSGQRQGIDLLHKAMTHFFGPVGSYLLTFCVFLFAYSSVIGNYVYAEFNVGYLTHRSRTASGVYKVLLLVCVYLGSVADLSNVWDWGDFTMGIMASINLIGLLILSPKAIRLMRDYDQKRKMVKEPIFQKKDFEGEKGIEVWD